MMHGQKNIKLQDTPLTGAFVYDMTRQIVHTYQNFPLQDLPGRNNDRSEPGLQIVPSAWRHASKAM